MRFVARFVKAIGAWLDRKFPDKMTTDEVRAQFQKFNERLLVLERMVPALRVDISKVKLLSGLEQLTGVSE